MGVCGEAGVRMRSCFSNSILFGMQSKFRCYLLVCAQKSALLDKDIVEWTVFCVDETKDVCVW